MLLLANVLAGLGWTLYWFLQLYSWVLIARAVVSWVSADPRNPIVSFLYAATEPPLRLIRRRLPTSLRTSPSTSRSWCSSASSSSPSTGSCSRSWTTPWSSAGRRSAEGKEGQVKISPTDIQRQTFGRRFRGLDPDEVRSFLATVAEEMAALLREKDTSEQQLRHLELIVNDHRERETILKNTLLTAQRVSENIREAARKEAETVVKQAELQGDRLLELAQNRAHEVERGILDLRGHRTALRTDIRAVVTRLTHLLDLQEEAEVEDNLRFLKRREEASGQ